MYKLVKRLFRGISDSWKRLIDKFDRFIHGPITLRYSYYYIMGTNSTHIAYSIDTRYTFKLYHYDVPELVKNIDEIEQIAVELCVKKIGFKPTEVLFMDKFSGLSL